MKRSTKLGLSAALSAAMAVGMTGSVASAPDTVPNPITAEQRAGYDAVFASAQEYWTSRGVHGLEDTHIKYIAGLDIGRCALFGETRSGDTSNYCPFNNTVYMTAQNVTAIPAGSYAGLFFAAQEYVHRVQDAEGTLWHNTPRTTELGATCLAGQFMIDVYPMQVITSGASDVLQKTTITMVIGGNDALHGTVEAQQQALAEGITTHDCTKYGLPY
jgi:hypothetical protein